MDDGDLDPPDAFEVLADETRLRTLFALADHQREAPDDRALGFADLRKRVGMRDSGNFDYHLDRLRGRFVERVDGGYALSPRGMRVVGTLAAGTYGDDDGPGPVELDSSCPRCGGAITAVYEQGVLTIECPEELQLSNFVPPAVVDERSIDDLIAHFVTRTRQDVEHLVDGICPMCFNPVESEPVESADPAIPQSYEVVCQSCGLPSLLNPAAVALAHPATNWFAHEHGVDGDLDWILQFSLGDDVERIAGDPPRYEVVAEAGGETLTVIVDGLEVVDVERS